MAEGRVLALYILRHGIAVPHGAKGIPENDRPLTSQGKKKMRRAARGMATLDLDFSLILTSPLPRASQTAQIVADVLKSEERVQVMEELLPEKPPQAAAQRLSDFKKEKSLLFVGHEPHLSRLISYLVFGNESENILLKKGGLARIDIHSFSSPHGTLTWLLTPKQLRLVGKV